MNFDITNSMYSIHVVFQLYIMENIPFDSVTRTKAMEAITDFFFDFHLVEVQEGLRDLLRAATQKQTPISDRQREDFVYFCDKLELLVESVYLLNKNTSS
jgi:hypothetical protein